MKQFFVIAYRNLIAHRTRTLIIGGAITLVTSLLVLMLALTSGIRTKMVQNATALSTGHLNIGGFLKRSQSSSAPIIQKLAQLKELVAKNVPEAAIVIDRVRAYGKIISETQSIMVPMSGVDMATEKQTLGSLGLAQKSAYIENYKPAPGEPQTEGSMEELARPGNVVLFAAQAKKLKVRVGDSVTLSMPTYRNIYNTKDVKVVAVLQDLGMLSSFSAFMHHQDAREIYDMTADSTGVIQIYLKSIDDVARIELRLRELLAKNGFELMDKDANPFWMKFERVAGESWTGQRLDVTTWEDEISFLKWILDIFNALTIVLTTVLLFIVIVGLINNMWIAIRERTAEIGTMRAVGLQRSNVLQMFIFESMILSVAAVGAGLLLGSLVAGGLNLLKISVSSEAFIMFLMSNELWLNVRAIHLTGTFFLLTFLLSIASLIPAYQASRLKPVTAINHVN